MGLSFRDWQNSTDMEIQMWQLFVIPLLCKPNPFEMHFWLHFPWTERTKRNAFKPFRRFLLLNWKPRSIFLFSSCLFGSWVVYLKALMILRWKNNDMGIKENDIFLGVYFLLPNKVLKSMSGYVKEWYASSFFINEFISANCTFGNASHHELLKIH